MQAAKEVPIKRPLTFSIRDPMPHRERQLVRLASQSGSYMGHLRRHQWGRL
jgi:hypothetical protein